MDENGHKAQQHDNDLEHISPDHSFHATLLQTDDGRERQTDSQGNTPQYFLFFLSLECYLFGAFGQGDECQLKSVSSNINTVQVTWSYVCNVIEFL